MLSGDAGQLLVHRGCIRGFLSRCFDSPTQLSQCTAACANFVTGYVFAIAACSVASAVYRFSNARK